MARCRRYLTVRPALSAPAPATATLKCPKWSRLLPFDGEEEVATRVAAAMLLRWWRQEWVVDCTMSKESRREEEEKDAVTMLVAM